MLRSRDGGFCKVSLQKDMVFTWSSVCFWDVGEQIAVGGVEIRVRGLRGRPGRIALSRLAVNEESGRGRSSAFEDTALGN